MPFQDNEADAVYCVSVLEHIPNPERTVKEVARILQPGGVFVLTIDLDLQKEAENAMANKSGAVVAMDVQSGRLLVFASVPGLTLENFIGGISNKKWEELNKDPLHPLINKALQAQ